MATEDQLVSITLEDLSSLIDCYVAGNNPHATLDPLYNLRTYQRMLRAGQIPKHINLDILTLNNHWDSDGLFLLMVSKKLFNAKISYI